jgi:transposase
MVVAAYSDEFKLDAIKQVVDGGHPVLEIARRLGVSRKSIYTWLKELGGTPKAAKQTENAEALKVENARLKAELKRTKEERDILIKAAACFARASE